MILDVILPKDIFSVLVDRNKNTSECEYKVMVKQRYLNSEYPIKIASIKDVDLIEKKYENIKYVNLQSTYYVKFGIFKTTIECIQTEFEKEIQDALEIKRCELLHEDDNVAIIIAKKMIKEGYDNMLKSNEYPVQLLNIAKDNLEDLMSKYIKRSMF